MSWGTDIVGNGASLILLILIVTLPVYGPFMVFREGELWPVTSKIEIVQSTPSGNGLDIRFSYEKYRNCEFLALDVTVGDEEIPFEIVGGSAPVTRLPGRSVSRLWHLDRPSLDGVKMWFVHRCHPFWLTATKVYG